jgi:hypothetical protein
MADFGPNSTAVARFLERIQSLEEGDALALTAAWKAGDERARHRATEAVQRAARDAGRIEALEEAQAAVGSWSNGWAERTAPGPIEAGDVVLADVMREAIPPLIDAAGAIVVGDLIDPGDFETLAGPWRGVEGGAPRP